MSRWLRVLALAATLAASAAVAAHAEVVQQGNLPVTTSGKLAPSRLPRSGAAPIAVTVGGRIATADGTLPPQLKSLRIELNRHGRLETTGLPGCKVTQIQPASTARALLGQIYAAHPFATSFVIPFVIHRRSGGRYGTALTATVPRALADWGHVTGLNMRLHRVYSYRGKRRSLIGAGCPAPKGFPGAVFTLARTTFAFAGGEDSPSTTAGSGGESGSAAKPSGQSKPQRHEDSGGGSAQLRVDGNAAIVDFGEEAGRAEFERAAANLHDFFDAVAAGDWDGGCQHMAKKIVEGLERIASGAENTKVEGCAELLEKLVAAAPGNAMQAESRQADVVSVRVEGDRAYAIYRGRGGAPRAIGMVKEDGEWKVAGLVGTPLG